MAYRSAPIADDIIIIWRAAPHGGRRLAGGRGTRNDRLYP